MKLLTNPAAAGYVQNPISVYYCYGEGGEGVKRCIAEVRVPYPPPVRCP